jgi:hypothetical protein
MPLFSKPGHPTERRGEVRRRIDSHGLILGDGQETPCLIVDQSDAGLRIRLDRAIGLPGVIVVVDLAAGTACEASVAWANGHDVGLVCSIRQTLLSGLVPARLAAARDAWLRHRGPS